MRIDAPAPTRTTSYEPVLMTLESLRPFGSSAEGTMLVTQSIDLAGGDASRLEIRRFDGDRLIAAEGAAGLRGPTQQRKAQAVLDALRGTNWLDVAEPSDGRPLNVEGFRFTVTDVRGERLQVKIPLDVQAVEDVARLATAIAGYGVGGYGPLAPLPH